MLDIRAFEKGQGKRETSNDRKVSNVVRRRWFIMSVSQSEKWTVAILTIVAQFDQKWHAQTASYEEISMKSEHDDIIMGPVCFSLFFWVPKF